MAAFYFLMIRPNQRRRMQAMRQSRAFDIGDEVVAGGMVGRVVRIGDGEVDVEVADGVNYHVRQPGCAVSRLIQCRARCPRHGRRRARWAADGVAGWECRGRAEVLVGDRPAPTQRCVAGCDDDGPESTKALMVSARRGRRRRCR